MFGDLLTSIGQLLIDFISGLFSALIAPFIEGIFGAPEEEEEELL